MSYVILEKDGQGTPEIYDRKEAQDLVDKGYTVRITKTDWVLEKKGKKTKKTKTKKK